MGLKMVLVTTDYRGVFAGYIDQDSAPDLVVLTKARNVIYWSADVNGVFGLAKTGPSAGCKIGPAVDRLRAFKVTSVTDMTLEAQAKWEALP